MKIINPPPDRAGLSMLGRGSLALLFCLSWSVPASAGKPPRVGYVFPPAVRAGETTEARFGGYDFTPDLEWFAHENRTRLRITGSPGDYQLTPPPYWIGPRAGVGATPAAREVSGRIETAADMPEGLVRWQAANANGTSRAAVFYVSKGREILEARSRDLPQRLPSLPVAVSGRLSRLTETDRYEIVVESSGLVSLDLMARRLGSDFNGMLAVRDSAGNPVADFADTQGLDGGLSFVAKAGEVYTVEVFDADFRGDRSYVYRLAAARGPRVLRTIPAAGRRGSTRVLEFLGQGVATGSTNLESIRDTVAFPADARAASYTHVLNTSFGRVAVAIPLSDLDEYAHDLPSTATAPFGLTRLMPPDVDEQRATWISEKDERWSVEARSRALGARLDVALAILGPDGKPIAENDDGPGTTDASLEFIAKEKGRYTCVARAMNSRAGTLDETYRLEIRRPARDFSLTVPQEINVPLGGKTEVVVQASRTGGFSGEIAIFAEGLPRGVSVSGDWRIPADKNELKAVLSAAPDADVVASPVRFRGESKNGDARIVRSATAISSGNLCPLTPEEQRIDVSLLAVTMAPPFEILLVDRTRQREVHRGSTCLADMEIVRKNGFAGEIRIEPASAQSRYLCGSWGMSVLVPPNATRTVYPTWMSERLATEFTMRMAVQGVAAVPDPSGRLRYLTNPADAQITMIMEGALLKLASTAKETAAEIGESFEVPVNLSRSAKLPVASSVELVVPDEIAGLLRAEPLSLPPGSDRGVLRIAAAVDDRLIGSWTLRLRAKALQDGKWPVISETEFDVEFRGRRPAPR